MFVFFVARGRNYSTKEIKDSGEELIQKELKQRWPNFLPSQGRCMRLFHSGKSEKKGESGYEFSATPEEIRWANALDVEYLNFLKKRDPDKFLREMTPNNDHNVACEGLDIGSKHHINLQKQFQKAVKSICKRKGLVKIPRGTNHA